MDEFSNAKKLAAVLSDWARPAISQIATNKLSGLPVVKGLNDTLIKNGFVGNGYTVANELMPFIHNGVDALLTPFIEMWLSKFPDSALPTLAHSVCETAMRQPKFSILDGLIEFEDTDILELKDLLDKNIPIEEKEKYNVIK